MKVTNKEIDDVMVKLASAVAFAKAVRSANDRNTEDGGRRIKDSIGNPSGNLKKMYVKRKQTSGKVYYHEDEETRDLINLLIKAVEEAFDINISRSILIRAGIRSYFKHFENLMATGRASEDIIEFLKMIREEKDYLKSIGQC